MKEKKQSKQPQSVTAQATAYYAREPRQETVSCTVRIKREDHDQALRAIGKLRAKGNHVTMQSVLTSGLRAFVAENQ